MAGTLTISTLSDGTNSTSSTNCIQGSAKAWVYFDGYTGGVATTKASFNVSSVTRNSTGNYTVAFTSALADANYAVAGSSGSYSASVQLGFNVGVATNNTHPPILKSTTQLTVVVATGASYDSIPMSVVIFR